MPLGVRAKVQARLVACSVCCVRGPWPNLAKPMLRLRSRGVPAIGPPSNPWENARTPAGASVRTTNCNLA